MTNPLRPYDLQLLVAANHITGNSPAIRVIVYGVAELLIFLFPLILYLLWRMPEARGRHHAARKAVIIALMASIMAIAFKTAISVVYVRSRPFVSHPELQYFHLGIDSQSFPSGHAMVAFAIALSLYLSGFRMLGGWLLVFALLISLGRVFAGVHYPTDVFGGVIVGSGIALYLHREASTLRKYLPNN